MPTTTEELIVKLSADIRDLKKGLDVARGDLRGFRKDTDSAAKAIQNSLSAISANAYVQLGKEAFRAAERIGEFVHSAVQAADAVGDAAAAVGLSTKSFQQNREAMSFSDISAEEFEASMRKLADVTGNAIAGNKEALQSFRSLGIELRDNAGHIKTQDEILDEVTAKLGGYGSEAERAALATDLFGRSTGPKLAAFASQGVEAIDALRQKAAIFSEEQIRLASEVNDKWEKLTTTVGVSFKAAILDALKATGQFVSGFSLTEVNNEIAKTTLLLDQLRADAALQHGRGDTLGAEESNRRAMDAAKRLKELGAAQKGLLGKEHDASPEVRDQKALQSELARLHKEALEENEKLDKEAEHKRKAAAEKAVTDATARDARVTEQKQVALDKYYDALDDQRIKDSEREKKQLEVKRQLNEDYLRERAQMEAEKAAKLHDLEKQRFEEMSHYADTFAENVGDAFLDATRSGENAFDKIKRAFIATIQEMLVKEMITKPLQGLLGGLINGTPQTSDGGGPEAGTAQSTIVGGAIRSGAGALISKIPSLFGFAEGGSFRVGGSGGTDSQMVAFKASPNETVSVSTPDQAKGGSGGGGLRVELVVEKDMTTTEEKKRNSRGDDVLRVVVRKAVQDELGRRGPLSDAVGQATGTRRPPRAGVQ